MTEVCPVCLSKQGPAMLRDSLFPHLVETALGDLPSVQLLNWGTLLKLI